MEYSFQRYLAAKRTVDDRALNRVVWEAMAGYLRELQRGFCGVLEVGAGTGTMFQRMVEWGALWRGDYLAVDASAANITAARQELVEWARRRGLACEVGEGGGALLFSASQQDLRLELESADVYDFMQRETHRHDWDVLIAHAFLDLFDIRGLVPRLLELVKPRGLMYLTINFDGETIFEPVWDAGLENQIIGLYHRSMDERISAGKPSGDSRAGRHLFQVLAQNQLEVLNAGSSDWVVHPHLGSYPADEAYFLHHILHFFEESVGERPEIEKAQFWEWIRRRHGQVERGELVYVAHQLDFLVRRPFWGKIKGL